MSNAKKSKSYFAGCASVQVLSSSALSSADALQEPRRPRGPQHQCTSTSADRQLHAWGMCASYPTNQHAASDPFSPCSNLLTPPESVACELESIAEHRHRPNGPAALDPNRTDTTRAATPSCVSTSNAVPNSTPTQSIQFQQNRGERPSEPCPATAAGGGWS